MVVVAVVSILAYGVVLGSAFDETVSWENVSSLSRDWYCNRSSIWLGHRRGLAGATPNFGALPPCIMMRGVTHPLNLGRPPNCIIRRWSPPAQSLIRILAESCQQSDEAVSRQSVSPSSRETDETVGGEGDNRN